MAKPTSPIALLRTTSLENRSFKDRPMKKKTPGHKWAIIKIVVHANDMEQRYIRKYIRLQL
jgi:hypothetical protein